MGDESKKNVFYCHSGRHSENSKQFLDNNRIYLPITEFSHDLSHYEKDDIIRELISFGLKGNLERIAGILIVFCKRVNIDDYLIFCVGTTFHKNIFLCKVIGDYEYLDGELLCHSRKMKIILKDIPIGVFADRSRSYLKSGTFRRITNPYELIITIKHYAEFLYKEGRIDKVTLREVKSIDLTELRGAYKNT